MTRTEKIESMLRDKFGAEAEIIVTDLHHMVDIEIAYRDGITQKQARRWIDHNISCVGNITLYRSYSEQSITYALHKMYDTDTELQLWVESFLAEETIKPVKQP